MRLVAVPREEPVGMSTCGINSALWSAACSSALVGWENRSATTETGYCLIAGLPWTPLRESVSHGTSYFPHYAQDLYSTLIFVLITAFFNRVMYRFELIQFSRVITIRIPINR